MGAKNKTKQEGNFCKSFVFVFSFFFLLFIYLFIYFCHYKNSVQWNSLSTISTHFYLLLCCIFLKTFLGISAQKMLFCDNNEGTQSNYICLLFHFFSLQKQDLLFGGSASQIIFFLIDILINYRIRKVLFWFFFSEFSIFVIYSYYITLLNLFSSSEKVVCFRQIHLTPFFSLCICFGVMKKEVESYNHKYSKIVKKRIT